MSVVVLGLLVVLGGCAGVPRPAPAARVYDYNAYERAGYRDPSFYGGVTVIPGLTARPPRLSEIEVSALPSAAVSLFPKPGRRGAAAATPPIPSSMPSLV